MILWLLCNTVVHREFTDRKLACTCEGNWGFSPERLPHWRAERSWQGAGCWVLARSFSKSEVADGVFGASWGLLLAFGPWSGERRRREGPYRKEWLRDEPFQPCCVWVLGHMRHSWNWMTLEMTPKPHSLLVNGCIGGHLFRFFMGIMDAGTDTEQSVWDCSRESLIFRY